MRQGVPVYNSTPTERSRQLLCVCSTHHIITFQPINNTTYSQLHDRHMQHSDIPHPPPLKYYISIEKKNERGDGKT